MQLNPKSGKGGHPASAPGKLPAPKRRPAGGGRRSRMRPILLVAGFGMLAAGAVAVFLNRPVPGREGDIPAQTNQANEPKPPLMTPPAPLASHALSTNSAATPSLIDTNDPVQLMNQGTALLQEGKADEALMLYRQALKLNPEDEEAQFNLGYAYTRLGRTNEAVQAYQEALRIFPEYVEAHNNLGNLLSRLRRYDEAIGHFNAALKINPDYFTALNSLGRALAAQGKTAEAIPHFSEAVRLNTNYLEARFNLGMAFLVVGKTDEAIAEFTEVLRQEPQFQPAIVGLAQARQKKSTAPK